MSRTDQYIGLTETGNILVANLIEAPEHRIKFDGLCNEVELNAWVDEEGVIIEEYVQLEIWSAGPMYFTALRKKDTKETIPVSYWSREPTKPYNPEYDQLEGKILI